MEIFVKNSSPSISQNKVAKQWDGVQYPCAACKSLRRRCSEKCILAPYFPSSEPLRFAIVHKVFGACNIIRRLQEICEEQRVDAVNSMVYEASARIRDPVYGCAGAVSLLHERNIKLQEELAKAQAQIFNMQSQISNLASSLLISDQLMFPSQEPHLIDIFSEQQQQPCETNSSDHLSAVEAFWTYEDIVQQALDIQQQNPTL